MGIPLPEPITVDTAKSKADSSLTFNKEACLYDRIYIYYGSETGKSLRLATMLTSEFDKDIAIGPIPLDGLPDLLVDSKVDIRALVLIVTSTFGKDNPPTAAQDFERRMKDEVAEKSVRNIDFAVLALGNSAYTESFVAFGHKVENHLQTAGCSRIMTMQVADELKNQQAGYDSFLNILMDEESGVIYVNQNRNKKDTTLDTSEDSYQQATVCFLGSTPVLHRETVEGMEDEMERQLLEKFDDSWESHTHKLGRFMDQFNFIVYPEYQDLISRLTPGDHIALYPSNMDDVVESVYRSVDVNDEDRKEARTQLKYKIDLSRPLGSSQLLELRKLLTDQPSQRIMDLTLKKSTHSNNPSMERLVQILPPGSISMHWISKYCPPIDPRFYSISSLDQKKKIVSITQSVYSFKDTGKAGTTSRWLRSLKAGDKARAIFAPTSFHLPSDKTGPLLCFSTGSGISSFRSFWLSREKRSNPMYLFYGCRKPSELPFSAEIQRLEMQGRMYPFFAYSRIKEGKMRIDELIRNERGAILKLLYNSKTTVYMCGSPDLEATIRDSLVLVLAEGDEFHPGLGTIQSMERLVVMSQANRFIREVYGKASNTDDPMTMMWQESTAKIVRSTSAMHKVGVPREPVYKKASRKMSHLNYRSSALSFRSSTLRRFANDSIFPIDDDSDYDSDDSISGELIMDGTKSGNRTYNPRISVSRL
jgi:sulfite reductase alpha subunit-like flavoprotein